MIVGMCRTQVYRGVLKPVDSAYPASGGKTSRRGNDVNIKRQVAQIQTVNPVRYQIEFPMIIR
jgi:hypothetical protein